jgi:hypothetical protein
MLLVERHLLAQAAGANGVGAVIDQHVTLVGWRVSALYLHRPI